MGHHGSSNGLVPAQFQAIAWTSDDLLQIDLDN